MFFFCFVLFLFLFMFFFFFLFWSFFLFFFLLSLIVPDLNRPIILFILICYLLNFIQGIDLSHIFFFFVFILIVFRRFIFQNHRPITVNNLFNLSPFTFPSFLLPFEGGGGGCMTIQTFPFNHPRIYFYVLLSLILSFHLPFSWFILFYAGLLQLFTLSSSQNKIDIAVFFSLRTFA